ncbi:beta-1,3-galactosyltransferase 7-like [Hibiscus syriacus]|uniref:beta-1,3-galactosyltransferase 7-like n=1 Tax=Hibiscus syriacus TaxID=106335 RepID=UPI0019237D1B|nr:beta-1,3-galactosyltransferase 7-like [Hibiscus syriacus]
MKQRTTRIISVKWILFICIFFFALGALFSQRIWNVTTSNDPLVSKHRREQEETMSDDCDNKKKPAGENDVMGQVLKTHEAIESLDKTVAMLQMKLAASRRNQEMKNSDDAGAYSTLALAHNGSQRAKVFMVIGINTAFSSRKRRDSIRETWMPQGHKLVKLEREKGIVIRFMIGHSATSNSILDRAIDSEDAEHKDFLRLEHVEGYHELSAKTKTYFSTAVTKWDAEFYIKVDDDVHVNLGKLAATLGRHRYKPGVYIGCMKSGPVLSKKFVKYHEPEYWKFGEVGNKYFRHATGQIYAISKDLADYIAINQPILHKYANEDVSLGSWFIGLEVEHINDRSMCCRTPSTHMFLKKDCERKAQEGNTCVASFDWSCSGICKSLERMQLVHQKCGEGDAVVWSALI